MNNEKTAIVSMVSEGVVTPEEGLALLGTLFDLEEMGPYAGYVAVEERRNLPPWESGSLDVDRPSQLLSNNRCRLAIASANQLIISAMQDDDPEVIPRALAALDVAQVSNFRPVPHDVVGGYEMGFRHLERGDNMVTWFGGAGSGAWREVKPEFEVAPGWKNSMLTRQRTSRVSGR